MGKGRKQSAETTVTQQKLPKEFQPYFDRLLTRAEESSMQPYTPYGGQRLAGTTDDTKASYDMVRDVAAKGNEAAPGAMGVYQQNIDSANALMGQQPYQFSEYGGFEAGKADPYAGFKETKVDPYTDFSAYKASPFTNFSESEFSEFGGFEAGKADPYAGFKETKVDPYSGFSAFKADPYSGFSEADYSEYGFDPTEMLDAEKTSQYMDPYLRNVLDVEKAKAKEDYEKSRGSREATAAQAGAIGGSRSALMEAVAQGDMLNRMKDIESTGQQKAYQDAVSRFTSDRSAKFAREQAAAAEQNRVQTSKGAEKARVQKDQAAELGRIQGLNASEFARVQKDQAAELARVQGISVAEATRIQAAEAGELARTQNISLAEASRIQAAKAAEAARVQQGKAGEAGRVQTSAAAENARIQQMDASEFARVQQDQAAERARVQGISVAEAARIQQAEAAELARTQGISINEASRIQAARASERSRVQAGQFEANNQAFKNQMDAMGLKGDMASQMVQLGELARTGNIQAAQMLDTIGKAQQAQQQAGYDIGYEDFLRQQGYNQQQLGFMSNVLQGLPLANAGTTSQSTPYNPTQQALGAGLSALSLYKGFGG